MRCIPSVANTFVCGPDKHFWVMLKEMQYLLCLVSCLPSPNPAQCHRSAWQAESLAGRGSKQGLWKSQCDIQGRAS